jgi:hypothetical protein
MEQALCQFSEGAVPLNECRKEPRALLLWGPARLRSSQQEFGVFVMARPMRVLALVNTQGNESMSAR